jgi:diguanylate cyclase (GGDEF)-like protein/PAS domain S-box-containing protein
LSEFHPRLKRQLEALKSSDPQDAGAELLAQVSDAYHEIDQVLHGVTQTLPSFMLEKLGSLDGQSDMTLRSVEAEYRSLFENALCGIYRDKLDGTPVRCNPALVALNGYDSEDAYLTAVTGQQGSWYVDPARSDEFKRRMLEEGGVHDFVSEVYRHKTRERFWITENAWYVLDRTGQPIFIEGTIQDATERINAMAAVERQANVDALTGVASRFRFMNRLLAATGDPEKHCTLFSIDLDRFKEVNDQLGHAAGDAVLKAAAQRLQEISAGAALVARLGGDEFALMLEGKFHEADIEVLAARIVEALREPVEIYGRNIMTGASVGIASFPAHAADCEELLANADLSLYQVKMSGRLGYRLFDNQLRTRRTEQQEIEAELKRAILADELELYYQPIVNSGTGAVEAFEALMRWNHPARGFLQPGQFIPVAEEAGLMTELGNWAIRRACAQAVLLPDHIQVAVNVSPNQFRSTSIVSNLREALAATGLDAKRLVLEVTESVILSSEMIADKVLGDLLATGAQLALDDFGTGYSSLTSLQRYKFSKVKIDRSFVSGLPSDPANLAIVRAVLGIGQDLGVDVVAEGVEHGAEADALSREGCVSMQGYLFGKPASFSDVVANLAVSTLRSDERSAPESANREAVA